MSTKKVTTQQNAYAPAGMAAYNQLIPQAAGTLGQYMSNPFQSTFFQQMLGMGNANIGQQGQTQTANILRNAQSIGGGGGSNPYLQSIMAQQGRFNSGQQAGLFQNLLGQANQARMWATGTASGFNPLQTGGTQTQQTSGLGTWLPQTIGAGLGIASGFLGKGGGGGGATMGGGGANLSPFLGNGFGSNMPSSSFPSVMNYQPQSS